MMNREAIRRAIQLCGTQVELGRRIGVHQQTISDWLTKARGPLKAEHAVGIDQATDGQVPKWELRPDLWTPPKTAGRAA